MGEAGEPFAVGEWLVEPSLNCISFGESSLHLRPQVMEVLVYLAALDGRVATLESIHDALWRGRVVSTGAIYNCIAELRQALAASGSGLEYIETLPKRGYRLAPRIVTRPVQSAPGTVSIAVLPLIDRTGNDRQAYVCDGIADEVLYGLSKVDGVRVCSAQPLQHERLDTRAIGLRYGADLALSGSLQQQGRRLRVMLRLENVKTGHVTWSGRFEQEAADLLALQESVARQVIDALGSVLPGHPAPAPDSPGARQHGRLRRRRVL